MLKTKKGFTLIELMIVVAIIGILAAIAIPQFAQLISKSQEGATKGNLGTLRSALSIYYGDTEGRYPETANSLGALTAGAKYLQAIPSATLPRTTNNATGHTTSNGVVTADLTVNTSITDAGAWMYDNEPAKATWGYVLVNCSHSDLRGTVWTTY